MNFKQALSQAAAQSHAAGSISDEQLADVQAITEASVNRAAALEGFAAHKLGAGAAAVDWAGLVSAIQTLLPLILQIVALFKKPV